MRCLKEVIASGLPDQNGRLQIFEIHTKQMKDNSMLADDVDLEELACMSVPTLRRLSRFDSACKELFWC